MKSEDEWVADARRLLRAEMIWRGITYDHLTDLLERIGVENTSANVRTKISRGKFSAVFLIQCLTALGTKSMRLDGTTYSVFADADR
jgi:hypothetical protein